MSALVDDPLVQGWAADAALRALGAPADPGAIPGRLVVVALGRHAPAMARGAHLVFGEAVDEGLVVAPRSARGAQAPPRFSMMGASEWDADAGREVARRVGSAGPGDRVLLLHSQGGTDLMSLPRGSLTDDDVAATLRRLRQSGLPGGVVETLRARIDGLHGGGLARRAAPAQLLVLDLPGPRDAMAGSLDGLLGDSRAGPPGALPRSLLDGLPVGVRARLGGLERDGGSTGEDASDGEGARPGEGEEWSRAGPPPVLRALSQGDPGLDAAMAEARRRGFATLLLGRGLRGGAEGAGRGLARVAAALQDRLAGPPPPVAAFASGGIDGGADRRSRVLAVAEAALRSRRGVLVGAWSGPDEGDRFVVLVAGGGVG